MAIADDWWILDLALRGQSMDGICACAIGRLVAAGSLARTDDGRYLLTAEGRRRAREYHPVAPGALLDKPRCG
jgi:hypothetical protein